MARKAYSAEYKLRAVEAAENGENVRDVCRRLGVQPPRLYEWIKQREDLQEAVEKEALEKHGENSNLTLAQARQLEAAEIGDTELPGASPLIQAELDLLREEYAELRTKFLRLKAGAA